MTHHPESFQTHKVFSTKMHFEGSTCVFSEGTILIVVCKHK